MFSSPSHYLVECCVVGHYCDQTYRVVTSKLIILMGIDLLTVAIRLRLCAADLPCWAFPVLVLTEKSLVIFSVPFLISFELYHEVFVSSSFFFFSSEWLFIPFAISRLSACCAQYQPATGVCLQWFQHVWRERGRSCRQRNSARDIWKRHR